MAGITRFEDLEVWQLARELAGQVYQLTEKGNFSKDFGLRDQIRRAAGSVMHNIAEGFDGGSDKEFIRFLRYSYRSATEVQSQLYLAFDLLYIGPEEFEQVYDKSKEVKEQLWKFMSYLRTSSSKRIREDQFDYDVEDNEHEDSS